KDIRELIDEVAAEIPLEDVRTIVGVAGAVTTVTARALGLAEYARTRIAGAELPPPAVAAARDARLHATTAEPAATAFMHPWRVDVIGAGALIWSEISAFVSRATGGVPVVRTSEHDILDGIALSLRP